MSVASPYGDVRDVLVGLPAFGDDGFATLDQGGLPLYPVRQRIAELVRPDRVFEFGAYRGYALVAFACGWPHVRAFGWIDNEQHTPGSNLLCRRNLRSVASTAQVWFRTLSHRAGEFGHADLVHVDGEHTYGGCMLDLVYAFRLDPRVVLVDDYTAIATVKQATDDYARALDLEGFYVSTVNGLAVFAPGLVDLRGDLERAGFETEGLDL